MVPSSSILDAGSLHILEQLKYGKINIRQAAELLKVEPTILAYELAAKAADFSADFAAEYGVDRDLVDPSDRDPGDEPQMEDEEEEYNEQLMEVQPDVVINDDQADEEAEDEHEEPEQEEPLRMDRPNDNVQEERRRSIMEENRPSLQALQALQSMRPPPTGPQVPRHIPGIEDRGSSIKKEAEVDPIAATN